MEHFLKKGLWINDWGPNNYVIILSDEQQRIVFMLYTNLNRIQCQFGKKSFKTQCAHSTRGKTLKKKKEAGRDELSILIESFDSSIKTNLLRPPNITEAYIFARFHSFEYANFACVYTIYIPIATRPMYYVATYEEKYYDSWKFSLLSSKKEANKVILTTRLYFFSTEEPVLYPF